MADSANTLLQEFQKQKVSQESEVLQAAQRFINQFRSLRFFKESFVQEYNSQLLACSPDVRRFFSSLMGGNEVRNYLEFLEKQQVQQSSNGVDSAQTNTISDGYLPSPEDDLKGGQSSVDMISVSKAEWQEMKEQQKILMNQTQQLLNQVRSKESSSSVSATVGRYSEIIDDESSDS